MAHQPPLQRSRCRSACPSSTAQSGARPRGPGQLPAPSRLAGCPPRHALALPSRLAGRKPGLAARLARCVRLGAVTMPDLHHMDAHPLVSRVLAPAAPLATAAAVPRQPSWYCQALACARQPAGLPQHVLPPAPRRCSRVPCCPALMPAPASSPPAPTAGGARPPGHPASCPDLHAPYHGQTGGLPAWLPIQPAPPPVPAWHARHAGRASRAPQPAGGGRRGGAVLRRGGARRRPWQRV